MELCLKLMPVVSSNAFNAERKPLDDVVDELDRVFLRVLMKYFKHSNSSGIIDGRVLESSDYDHFYRGTSGI